MSKYKSLIVKMHLDSSKTKVAQNNLVLIGDLKLILDLPCLLPMLEVVHILIKFAQRQDVFIVEFADVMKLAKTELFYLYIDSYSYFESPTFDAFNSLINHTNQQLPLDQWYVQINVLNVFSFTLLNLQKDKFCCIVYSQYKHGMLVSNHCPKPCSSNKDNPLCVHPTLEDG